MQESSLRPTTESDIERIADRARRNLAFRVSLGPAPKTAPGQIEQACERIRAAMAPAPGWRVSDATTPKPAAACACGAQTWQWYKPESRWICGGCGAYPHGRGQQA